ncbi:hypothetical protein L226DRAFT_536226 [Lentinus tigrinus ALCF2SS1-7]|uniref:uncharacterized protein n=1 Tax=Lentinus tigrinus ALCF2SS1-7 TaxID=1328758 RepID=UPI001165DA48|nr:hypothetical protein L226DRAFT_536226 [Lentinus tigrinus ALCF2SS1-7]
MDTNYLRECMRNDSDCDENDSGQRDDSNTSERGTERHEFRRTPLCLECVGAVEFDALSVPIIEERRPLERLSLPHHPPREGIRRPLNAPHWEALLCVTLAQCDQIRERVMR